MAKGMLTLGVTALVRMAGGVLVVRDDSCRVMMTGSTWL